MAIYRPERSRWRPRLFVLATGLLAGVVAIVLLTRDREPNAEERAAALRTGLIEATGLLEIVEIEYAEAVRNGDVVAEAELEGAVDALARGKARYREIRAALDAEVTGDIDAAFAKVESLLVRRADPSVVANELKRLMQLMEEVVSAV